MAFGSVGQVALDLTLNTKNFTTGLNKTLNGLNKVATLVGSAFAVGAIVKFGKACLDLGSDLAEVQNVVDVTFGDMSDRVNAFAENAITTYGLSEKVAKQYMGTFGAMSKSFGFTVDQSYEMSAALTGLAADVASFYNLSTDEAYTKMKAVYTGETEALKELGVVMTQDALDAYAMSHGLGKATKNMTEQEKVSLRLAFVTDKLSAASGDFSRTSGGWANQVRVLSLRFDALKASIGQGLISALTPVVQWLNVILSKLQVVADAFANLMARIFGKSETGSSPLAAASEDAESIASGLDSATGAAKTLKRTMAGFDEMNIMSSGDSGSGSSGGSTSFGSTGALSGLATESALSGFDTSELEGKLVSLGTLTGEALLGLGVLIAFSGANIPLGIGLMVAGALLLKLSDEASLNWGYCEDHVTDKIDVIESAVSSAFLALGAIIAISGVKPGLGIALMAVGALGLEKNRALNWNSVDNKCKSIITDIESTVSGALLGLGAILAFSGAKIPLGIFLMASGAFGLVEATGLNWNTVSKSVSDKMDVITTVVSGAMLGLGAVLAFSGANVGLGLALMAGGAVGLANSAAQKWDAIPAKTKQTMAIVSGIAGAALIALGVILLFTGAGIPLGLGLIAAGGVALASAIAPNWDKITSKIKEICDKIGGFFSDMWDGIESCFTRVINSIIGTFEGFINGIIGGINWLIKAINKISFTVPDWVPGIGGKKVGFTLKEVNKVSLPRLATGGYVAANTPQLAVVGDNRHEGEIIAPESKIAEAVAAGVASAMRQVMQLMGQPVGQTQGNTKVVLSIDGRELGYATIDNINKITRQTGALQLNLT